MPELPDIEAYRFALDRAVCGSTLTAIQIHHPFLLRSVKLPPESAVGAEVTSVTRLGKRIVFHTDRSINLVIHLMIAGRFKWSAGAPPAAAPLKGGRGKSGILAWFDFAAGRLTLTEAGSKRRASLHVVGDDGLAELDPGGIELLDTPNPVATRKAFADALQAGNHTIKRSLTDPHLFSGIGNSYSDEILFAAKLSPFAMSQSLEPIQIDRLFDATVSTLTQWRDRLCEEAASKFPTKVTAFRPEMHVHGKYGEQCSVCRTPVQRIRYAENECNYCPGCQTGGKVYADRALSRLLKNDWPRSVEELEQLGKPPGSPS